MVNLNIGRACRAPETAFIVIPAKVGIRSARRMGSRFRGSDEFAAAPVHLFADLMIR
jgi:hypothetical protein